MELYASVEDLEARWKKLSEEEKERAGVLLHDASALIDSYEPEVDDSFLANAVSVCCSMVQRAMSLNDDFFGMTQMTQTAGSYSQSFTPSNPSGDLYLTRNEKKRLKLSRMRVGAIRAAIHDEAGDLIAGW